MRTIKFLSVVLIAFMITAGISIPMVSQPQGWLEFPLIPGLGEKARNVFFHVPIAWISLLGFLVSLYNGIRFLYTRDMDDDIKSASSAGLGFVFCILAAVTGSVWAKFNWGAFWNWDPRETSIFFLLLIYGAYFALRSAIDSEEIRAKLSAVYSIIAGATAPFFIFVLPRLAGGLHPGAGGGAGGAMPITQLSMPLNMLVVFFAGMAGFSFFFFWLLEIRVRVGRLEYKLYL